MPQTVSEVLTKAIDSVTLINDINTNGSNSKYAGSTTDKDGNVVATEWTQDEINIVVQKNVDHLETILAYAPVDSDDNTPNVVGSSSSKKTDCTNAINTGKAYISSNS